MSITYAWAVSLWWLLRMAWPCLVLVHFMLTWKWENTMWNEFLNWTLAMQQTLCGYPQSMTLLASGISVKNVQWQLNPKASCLFVTFRHSIKNFRKKFFVFCNLTALIPVNLPGTLHSQTVSHALGCELHSISLFLLQCNTEPVDCNLKFL